MKAKPLTIFIAVSFISVAYFFPAIAIFYLICAFFDLARNKTLVKNDIKRYFVSYDFITWIASPFNLLTDLLVWGRPKHLAMDELPAECQDELNTVFNSFDHEEMFDTLKEKVGTHGKGMLFFKWYGVNLDNPFNNEAMQYPFKYIKTIGVSVFNKQSSFGRHFGPLRLTNRVLLNLNPVKHDGIYLEVDGYRHYWHDNPLLIFDDTYIHESHNESEFVRCVMFIDIVRPSKYFSSVIGGCVTLLGYQLFLLRKVNKALWDFLYGDWTDLNAR